jgi:galactokinase
MRSAFAARFGHAAAVVARAPGRVNLIGEHTDYNDGFVLPIATQYGTWVAAANRPDGLLRVYSTGPDEEHIWPADNWNANEHPHWTSYVAGVVMLLHRRNIHAGGADLFIHSDVPLGGGLSSSASLTVSVAKALAELAQATPTIADLAAWCRLAEHEFAGVPCGVMDQYASLACRAGEALLLDCRSLAYEYVPLPPGDDVFLVIDSGVRHSLAAGEYAKRQHQCAEALAYFQARQPAVRALRDVDPDTVAAATDLPPLPAARARHVATENQRTLAAAEALRHADAAEMGRLMLASHASLRDDYEVSCDELDLLVELVQTVPGVWGVRMTGGGFGGCTVALARAAAAGPVEQILKTRYDRPDRRSRLLLVHAGAGASTEYP